MLSQEKKSFKFLNKTSPLHPDATGWAMVEGYKDGENGLNRDSCVPSDPSAIVQHVAVGSNGGVLCRH
jgi:hypothetical protein